MSNINQFTTPLGPADITGPEYRKVVSSTVPSSTSNSITNVVLSSILIPANTFTTNEVLDIKALVTKTGVNGTCTVRAYLNTTPAIGGQIVGLNAFQSTCLFLPFLRRAAIRRTTAPLATIVLRNTTNAPNDIWFNTNDYNGHTTGGLQALPVVWTSNVYLVIAGQLSSNLDVMQCRYLKINN